MCFIGATTFSITTISITPFSIMDLIVTFRIMSPSISIKCNDAGCCIFLSVWWMSLWCVIMLNVAAPFFTILMPLTAKRNHKMLPIAYLAYTFYTLVKKRVFSWLRVVQFRYQIVRMTNKLSRILLELKCTAKKSCTKTSTHNNHFPFSSWTKFGEFQPNFLSAAKP